MNCGHLGLYIKSLGNYDKYVALYYKYFSEQVITLADPIYLVTTLGV